MSTIRSRTRGWPVVLAAAALTGAVSCRTTTDAAQTRTVAVKGATTTAVTSPADREAAEGALITAADVPDGFKEVMSMSSGSSSSELEGVPECAPFAQASTATDAKRTAKAQATFKDADNDEIVEAIEVYDDVEIAQRIAGMVADPAFATCFQAGFTKGLSSATFDGATMGNVSVAPIRDLPTASSLGIDSATGIVVEIPFSAAGRTVTYRSELVMLTSGRATANVTVQSSEALDVNAIVQAAATKLDTIDAG